MEEDTVFTKSEFCFACLGYGEEKHLQNFVITNESLKVLLGNTKVTICYICKKIAQRVENFVHNVQTSQKLLDNLALINKSTLDESSTLMKQLVNLTSQNLEPLHLGSDESEDGCVVYSSQRQDVKVKLEMKVEDYVENILNGDFVDDDTDSQDNTFEVKDVNLEALLKQETDDEYKPTKTNKKKRKVKNEEGKKYKTKFNSKTVKLGIVEKVYISREDLMAERARRAAEVSAAPLRCEPCLKVFQYQDTYEKHMERHSESAGDYECDICKQRMETAAKLKQHQKYHRIRFKCSKCEVTNICSSEIHKHYREVHEGQTILLPCSHCSKVFNCQRKLRKHSSRHRPAARVVCDLCSRSYCGRAALRAHLATAHRGHGQPAGPGAHGCAACGKQFRAPSALRKHMLVHSDTKPHYCVECDKAFKSETSLQTHLKTTKLHLTEKELRFPCQHCDKKFSVRRDVERHTNSIHLNVRPYRCDKCDKAYVSKWSLGEHARRAHEGLARARRFPCPMCDKVFDRNQILASHIRTHTGERPFACGACGARFTQRSVLATHVRLVHLRLARDGQPRT